MDIEGSVHDSNVVALDKFKDCDFVPTTRDLFLAGAAIAKMTLNEGVDGWDSLRVYQTIIRESYESMMREMLPLHIDMRPSLFYVSEMDEGAGPVMEVGRKTNVTREDRDFSMGEEVHALLNPVRPQPGRWYSIPPRPFTVYPGISGWRVTHALSQVIDGEVAQLIARDDMYVVSQKKINRGVKTRTVVLPDAEGIHQYPVCGRSDKTPPLEHVFISGPQYAAVNVDVAGSMTFILPTEGRIEVQTVVDDGPDSNTMSYEVEPGGGVMLFSEPPTGLKRVRFLVRALERSGFLVFQPEMLRSAD